jgi:hypothetical protein
MSTSTLLEYCGPYQTISSEGRSAFFVKAFLENFILIETFLKNRRTCTEPIKKSTS